MVEEQDRSSVKEDCCVNLTIFGSTFNESSYFLIGLWDSIARQDLIYFSTLWESNGRAVLT